MSRLDFRIKGFRSRDFEYFKKNGLLKFM